MELSDVEISRIKKLFTLNIDKLEKEILSASFDESTNQITFEVKMHDKDLKIDYSDYVVLPMTTSFLEQYRFL